MRVSVEEFLQSCGVDEDTFEHGDWKKHKYISKHPSKKSGKMVYKYPKDSKDDSSSGFTIGRTNKSIIEQQIGISSPDGEHDYNTKSYYIDSPETNGEWKRVSEEEYNSTSAGYNLYYNNKKVTTIIKESADKVLSSVSNAVNSGRDFLANFLEDAADTIRPKKK